MQDNHPWHLLGMTMMGIKWVSFIDLARAVFVADDTRFTRLLQAYVIKHAPTTEAKMIRWTVAYVWMDDLIPADDIEGHAVLDAYDWERLERAAKRGWDHELLRIQKGIQSLKRDYNAAFAAASTTDWHIPAVRAVANKPS